MGHVYIVNTKEVNNYIVLQTRILKKMNIVHLFRNPGRGFPANKAGKLGATPHHSASLGT